MRTFKVGGWSQETGLIRQLRESAKSSRTWLSTGAQSAHWLRISLHVQVMHIYTPVLWSYRSLESVD